MPNRKITGLPILGIAWDEDRDDGSVLLQTKHYGPCSGCGVRSWLDQKDGQGYLCQPCYEDHETYDPDPILGDIRGHLQGVYQEVTDQLLEVTQEIEPPSYHAISTDVHEDVDELICPECLEQADTLVEILSQWVCEECIERATGGQIVGARSA